MNGTLCPLPHPGPPPAESRDSPPALLRVEAAGLSTLHPGRAGIAGLTSGAMLPARRARPANVRRRDVIAAAAAAAAVATCNGRSVL